MGVVVIAGDGEIEGVKEYGYALAVELSRKAVQSCSMYDKPRCVAAYAQT